MSYYKKFIFTVIFFTFFLCTNLFLNAAGLKDQVKTNLGQSSQSAGFSTTGIGNSSITSTSNTIGLIIAVILGFLGMLFLILTIYSGFQWMTAGGNEETVTKAKKRLTNSVIGLVIVMAAYIITYFIVEQLYDQFF